MRRRLRRHVLAIAAELCFLLGLRDVARRLDEKVEAIYRAGQR